MKQPKQMNWTIRKALPSEAERLATFGANLFRQAYEETHPEPALSVYLANAFDVHVVSQMLEDPASTVLLVEMGARWIGYAELHQGAPASATTVLTRELPGCARMEVVRFYVDQTWHGRGVAQSLMQACDDLAQTRGCDALWLQAWQQAPQAIRFYQKIGFEIFGTAVFNFGDRTDSDFILARPVRQLLRQIHEH